MAREIKQREKKNESEQKQKHAQCECKRVHEKKIQSKRSFFWVTSCKRDSKKNEKEKKKKKMKNNGDKKYRHSLNEKQIVDTVERKFKCGECSHVHSHLRSKMHYKMKWNSMCQLE